MVDVFPTSSKLWVRVQIALKMTQRELADLVGVERRTIQRWSRTWRELDHRRSPFRAAKAQGATVEGLLLGLTVERASTVRGA